ncbi:MAG: hypothetical protein JXX29_02500 [Deltaproteobacteria bacterium]|nr:hypothetical protein [Deltaproteobacteria bacterium]
MHKRAPKHQFFAACAPGLEDLLLDELKQLHVGNASADTAGVSFTGTFETMVRVNLQSRIAERILLRMASFSTTRLGDLQKESVSLPFERYIHSNCSVGIQASCKKSKIYHSGAAAERVANAIQSKIKLTSPPRIQTAPDGTFDSFTLIQIRIIRDEVTVSIDTTGELLHRRGYRTHVTEAPMRETVAAAALRFCDYSGEIPLVDPMCGSGTFPIEAALIASRTAPGINRSFAFEHWPTFDEAILTAEKKRAEKFAMPLGAMIQGSDKLSSVLKVASHNVEAAGFKNKFSLSAVEISRIELPGEPGLITVNPPWGKRLDANSKSPVGADPRVCPPKQTQGEHATQGEHTTQGKHATQGEHIGSPLQLIYQQIGDIKRANPSWKLCLVTSNPKLAQATGIRFKKISPPIPMGGVRIKFYLG